MCSCLYETGRAYFVTVNARDRKVYAAVLLRASPNGYPQCERCTHNGNKYPLQMSHFPSKQMGGRKNATTTETVRLFCLKCHMEEDHNQRIVG